MLRVVLSFLFFIISHVVYATTCPSGYYLSSDGYCTVPSSQYLHCGYTFNVTTPSAFCDAFKNSLLGSLWSSSVSNYSRVSDTNYSLTCHFSDPTNPNYMRTFSCTNLNTVPPISCPSGQIIDSVQKKCVNDPAPLLCPDKITKVDDLSKCPLSECDLKKKRVKDIENRIKDIIAAIEIIKDIIQGLERLLDDPPIDNPYNKNPPPLPKQDYYPDADYDGRPDYCSENPSLPECAPDPPPHDCQIDDPRPECNNANDDPPSDPDPDSQECQNSCCGNDPRWGSAASQVAGLRQDIEKDRARANLRLKSMSKFGNNKVTGFDAGRSAALDYFQDVLCEGHDCSSSYCDLNPDDTLRCSIYHDFKFFEFSDFGSLNSAGGCSCQSQDLDFGRYGIYHLDFCPLVDNSKEALSVVLTLLIAFAFVRIVLSA